MVVIAHHSISEQFYREDVGQMPETCLDPATAVLEAFAAEPVFSAEKGPPDAASRAVVVRRVVEGYRIPADGV